MTYTPDEIEKMMQTPSFAEAVRQHLFLVGDYAGRLLGQRIINTAPIELLQKTRDAVMLCTNEVSEGCWIQFIVSYMNVYEGRERGDARAKALEEELTKQINFLADETERLWKARYQNEE